MNPTSEAIIIFCSKLCAANGIQPLEPREWSNLAAKLMSHRLSPDDLLNFEPADFVGQLNCTSEEATRFTRLIGRRNNLRSELSKYENMGIRIMTRADREYPRQLKLKLRTACPPLFYYAGNPELLNRPAVGYVGSREIGADDIEFSRRAVAKTVGNGYAVVSGGARGIDTVAADASLSCGGFVIEYLSDSLLRKMSGSKQADMLRSDRVLLLSISIPTAGFNTGIAMMRNRYIYAQSQGTLVIRSDMGKGGTWAGATDNLRKKWCPALCRDCDHSGNRELIRLGSIPITDDWDGNVLAFSQETDIPKETGKPRQLSLFG